MAEGDPSDAGTGQGPMDFSTFVISLGTNALVQLGVREGEDGQKQAPDLALAQQSIDILSMLEDKTAGNLTEHEAKLLRQVLYQARMAFVDVSGRQSD